MSSKQPGTNRPVDHGWGEPPDGSAGDEEVLVTEQDAADATADTADRPAPEKGTPRHDPTKRPVDHGW